MRVTENQAGKAIEACDSQESISWDKNKPQTSNGLRQHVATFTPQNRQSGWLQTAFLGPTLLPPCGFSTPKGIKSCFYWERESEGRKGAPSSEQPGPWSDTHITSAYVSFEKVDSGWGAGAGSSGGSGWEMSPQSGQPIPRSICTPGVGSLSFSDWLSHRALSSGGPNARITYQGIKG